eukprot:1950116-Ditylum_brightwellii.AAC.1
MRIWGGFLCASQELTELAVFLILCKKVGQESGVDSCMYLVDKIVNRRQRFQVYGCDSFAGHVNGMEIGLSPWLRLQGRNYR